MNWRKDFHEDWGKLHHEKPVYQYSDEGFDSYIKKAVLNLKPLCANCHGIIHRDSKRPLSVCDLKKILNLHVSDN